MDGRLLIILPDKRTAKSVEFDFPGLARHPRTWRILRRHGGACSQEIEFSSRCGKFAAFNLEIGFSRVPTRRIRLRWWELSHSLRTILRNEKEGPFCLFPRVSSFPSGTREILLLLAEHLLSLYQSSFSGLFIPRSVSFFSSSYNTPFRFYLMWAIRLVPTISSSLGFIILLLVMALLSISPFSRSFPRIIPLDGLGPNAPRRREETATVIVPCNKSIQKELYIFLIIISDLLWSECAATGITSQFCVAITIFLLFQRSNLFMTILYLLKLI